VKFGITPPEQAKFDLVIVRVAMAERVMPLAEAKVLLVPLKILGELD